MSLDAPPAFDVAEKPEDERHILRWGAHIPVSCDAIPEDMRRMPNGMRHMIDETFEHSPRVRDELVDG